MPACWACNAPTPKVSWTISVRWPIGRRSISCGRPALTDPRDEFILELAVAAGCEAIVTHNIRDFSGASSFRPRLWEPAEFLALLEERS